MIHYVSRGTIKSACARNSVCRFVVGDKSKVQKMVQMAWTFINDRSDAVQFPVISDEP